MCGNKSIKTFRSWCYGASGAACLTALSSMPVWAQEQSAVPAASQESIFEEVVVTARRRNENLQEVPIAISVITEDDVEKLGITRVADFVKLVPNVIFDSALNLGTNYLTIRGQTQSQYSPPPAAIVVDGVLTISPLQFNVDEFDLQQIEVLKGPQGALYGRNAIAGVINLTTRKPGDEFEGRLLAGYGRGEEYKARASVSGPLIADRLYASIGVAHTDRRGQVNNITTGGYTDHYEDTTGRLRVVATPTDSVELDLKYTYSDTKGSDPAYIVSRSGDPRDMGDPVDANREGANPRDLHDLAAKLDWEIDAGTFTLILAHVDAEEDVAADFDFTPLDIFRVEQSQEEYGFSQELRFSSNQDRELRWLLGAYHVKSTRKLGANIYADPFFLGLTPVPTSAELLIDSSFDINRYENYSGFGQVEYDLSSRLELAFALRYDEDTNEQNGTIEATFSKWQPKATLTFHASPAHVVYSSIGEGFRAGDFNASGATYGERVIKAETATTYELGVKSRLFGNRLATNFAVFYTDLENGQFKLFDAGGATNVGINIDKTRLQGFELETSAMIVEGLTVNAAIGYTDAEIEEFTPPTGFGGSTDVYVGNRPPRVPDYSFNAGFDYERPISARLNAFLRTDYRRIGDWYWDPENDYSREAVDNLDVRVGVRAVDASWALTGWVKNALDEKVTGDYQPFSNSGHPLGIDVYYPAVGVTYGVEVAYNF